MKDGNLLACIIENEVYTGTEREARQGCKTPMKPLWLGTLTWTSTPTNSMRYTLRLEEESERVVLRTKRSYTYNNCNTTTVRRIIY
jgi:hypothetical protein